MKQLLAIALLLFWGVPVWAQSTTVYSTGVVDTPDGSTWASGSYTVTFAAGVLYVGNNTGTGAPCL
jgi:hypothetical protein